MILLFVKKSIDPVELGVSGEDVVLLVVTGDGGSITGADEGGKAGRGEVGGGGRIVVLNGFPSFLQSRF